MEDNAKDAETPLSRRDTRFKPGNKFGVGNRRGKQKLTTRFVEDLTHEWNRRGMQALQDLDSKALVQACIAILPRDVLVSLDQSDKVRYVINAQPPMSVDEWKAKYLPRPVDIPNESD